MIDRKIAKTYLFSAIWNWLRFKPNRVEFKAEVPNVGRYFSTSNEEDGRFGDKLNNYATTVKRQCQTVVCTIITLTLLSGCGFKLRNDFELDDQFRKLRVIDSQEHSQLTDVLIKRLDVYQVEVINKTQPKTHQEFKVPTIVLAPEHMERKLLSLFPTGQVAEYELLYFCHYQVVSAQGETRQHSFEISREYQDDPDQVLAKSRELDLILSEMRAQAADRIIRQLSVNNRKS